MKVRVKAMLTVLGVLMGMMLLAYGILSIPKEWVREYGLAAIDGGLVLVSVWLMYNAAYEWFSTKENIKKIEQKEKRSRASSENDRVF